MGKENIVDDIFLEEKKERIAEAIKIGREGKNLTQEQLAGIVGLSRNSIARIENKRFFPSMENFLLICKALDLTLKIEDGKTCLSWC